MLGTTGRGVRRLGRARPSHGVGQGRPVHGVGQARHSHGLGLGRRAGQGLGWGRHSHAPGRGRHSQGVGRERPLHRFGRRRHRHGLAWGRHSRRALALSAGLVLTLLPGSATVAAAPVAAAAGGVGALKLASNQAPMIKVQTFPVPTASSGLAGIAVGPGGKTIWFTEKRAYKVGWINIATKKFTEEKVANNTPGVTGQGPSAIVRSGGAMWFVSDEGETVYRVMANGKGKVMSHDVDYPAGDIAPSSSGGIWLMAGIGGGNSPNALAMVGPNGKGSFYPGTFDNLLYAMALGPGGAVWYNDGGNSLNTMNTARQERSHPVSSEPHNQISSFAFGHNGAVYYTEFTPDLELERGCCGAVGDLYHGTSHLLEIGDQNSGEGLEPRAISVAPNGDLFFVFNDIGEEGFNGIGRINPRTGAVKLANTGGYVGIDAVIGPDGALWFVDAVHNVIGRIPAKELASF